MFTGQAMVWLDFIAAGHAVESGVLPCSSSERQLLLIAASIAEGRPVDLREALSGLDETDTGLVVRAVVHAAGHGGAGIVKLSNQTGFRRCVLVNPQVICDA